MRERRSFGRHFVGRREAARGYNSAMEFIAITAGVLVCIVLLAVLGVMIERKRDARLALTAEELALQYRRDGSDLLHERFTRFSLFQEGRRQRIRNVMQGAYDNIEVLLFDYRFTSGSHRHHRTNRQTVAAFQLLEQNLPEFSLRPEQLIHKLGGMLGYQDIDFDDSPKFSARYLLRGPDEDAIRSLFDKDAREFFEDHEPYCVEGGGRWLIVYRRDRRLRAAQLDDFLKEAFEICTLFAIRHDERVNQ